MRERFVKNKLRRKETSIGKNEEWTKSGMAEMTGSFHEKTQTTSGRRKRWFVKERQEKSIMKVTGRMRKHAESLSDSSQKKQELTETD